MIDCVSEPLTRFHDLLHSDKTERPASNSLSDQRHRGFRFSYFANFAATYNDLLTNLRVARHLDCLALNIST